MIKGFVSLEEIPQGFLLFPVEYIEGEKSYPKKQLPTKLQELFSTKQSAILATKKHGFKVGKLVNYQRPRVV